MPKTIILFMCLISVMCTMPSVPSNGVIESGIPDKLVSGVVIKYGCNVGFVINGSSEITCIDGDWSDDSPDCVGKIFMTMFNP